VDAVGTTKYTYLDSYTAAGQLLAKCNLLHMRKKIRHPVVTLMVIVTAVVLGLLYLVVSCSPQQPNNLTSQLVNDKANQHFSMEPEISSRCAKCGSPGKVAALKTDKETIVDPKEVSVFCEPCALQGIRQLPPCADLFIVAVSEGAVERTGRVRKQYQVLQLDQAANVATVQIIDSSVRSRNELPLIVRYDAIPNHARLVDATFAIIGIPRELSLFEQSGSM
jgi:hypothetical protein